MSESMQRRHASEAEARQLTEDSRDSWAGRSFLRELFLGSLRLDWIDPYPETEESEAFRRFYGEIEQFLSHEVDSAAIDREGELPEAVIQRLRDMGAFGMKIPARYGGLGFNQAEYCKLCELVGAYDGNLAALLSAHQSIGIPEPVKRFGTEAQKQTYLPRVAKGAISAFALTEADVGSDPARLATEARQTDTGDWIINGEKLWITNGTIAELLVVMARNPENDKISAFIVETSAEGFEVERRCHFMGLRALQNGVLRFHDVRVSADALLGEEGQGLKIALTTLNTGRLSLPAAAVGGARKAVEWSREWASQRVQWGVPVGKHEAISHKLAEMASKTWAMESWTRLAAELSMRDGYDIRLEAAAAKEWGSTRGWDITDELMQIRGGRGYETETSLAARGEPGLPVERMMRDSRINRIFEGSSEIMHLFMAREMVDKHLKVAGTLLDASATLSEKLAALPRIGLFYAGWYPRQWMGLGTFFRYHRFGPLGRHLRFAERASRRLARNVFHAMVRYQGGLERKQALLFRTVDIAMEIAVLCATVVRAQALVDREAAHASDAVALTESYALDARRLIDDRFRALWSNDDSAKRAVGHAVLAGTFGFVEDAGVAVPAPSAATSTPERLDPAAK